MPMCSSKTIYPTYDFKKEQEDALQNKVDREAESVASKSTTKQSIHEIDPCIEDEIHKKNMKQLFQKWEKLKRVKDIYNEQVANENKKSFKHKILRHMKKRIAEMPHEERRQWMVKLIRLAFLMKLKDVKDLRQNRKQMFLEQLKNSKDKQFLLEKIDKLKHMFDAKELDDVNDIKKIQKAKKEQKLLEKKKLELKVRIQRLKKLDEIKAQEEKQRRNERTQLLHDIIASKKNWEYEMIKKIDKVTKVLADEIIELKDKELWFQQVNQELQEEKDYELEEGRKVILQERLNKEKEKEKEMIKKRHEEKKKEMEIWNKEKNVRLWNLKKITEFEKFLENRYKISEENEEKYFKKIFKKLSPGVFNQVVIDPWLVKRKADERVKIKNKRKQMNEWLQDIISSNKKKIIHKIKLKKYLEIMETPQVDNLFSQCKKIKSIQFLMCVVRGRVFKSTFPEKCKLYIAKELGNLTKRTQLDIRELDPNDRLLGIQISTLNHELFISPGDEYMLIAQQKVTPPPEPCQGKTDVLCLTQEERDQILELVNKRKEARKVIKEKRSEEYEAYQNRLALDKAWMQYMKKAYGESIKDIESCKVLGDDIVKIELDQSSESSLEYDADETEIPGLLNEERIKELLRASPDAAQKKKKQPINISPEEAMERRQDRLIKMALAGKDFKPRKGKQFYETERPDIQDVLATEKTVRKYMTRNLPAE